MQHKRWVYFPKPVYYRYGFAKRLVSTCEDCSRYEFENQKIKPRIITVRMQINAFESICKVINRRTSGNPINYYDAVKMAYFRK